MNDRMDWIKQQLIGTSVQKDSFTDEEKEQFNIEAVSAITSVLDKENIPHSGDKDELYALFSQFINENPVKKSTYNEAFVAIAKATPEGQALILSALNFKIPDNYKNVLEAYAETSCDGFPQNKTKKHNQT